jgi:hypothetical protein
MDLFDLLLLPAKAQVNESERQSRLISSRVVQNISIMSRTRHQTEKEVTSQRGATHPKIDFNTLRVSFEV